MVRSFPLKAALPLVVILLLATPAVQAAEPGSHWPPATGLFAHAWEFLTRIWANNGCRIDPSGQCVPEQNATAEADNGCRIDPNGGCAH